MRFEDLYLCCFNLMKDSNIVVLEEGKKPIKAKLRHIYDEIYNRQVIWFAVDRQFIWFSLENGYMIRIKLKEE